MVARLTAAEFLAKYGDAPVVFESYYKYTFTFAGQLPNGQRIKVDCGENASDIYRFSVQANEPVEIARLDPVSGCVYSGDEAVEIFTE